MSIVNEFREFAVKGNMIDMAVGIIIGGAFGKIVNSLVNDVVMPPLGYLLGKVDFKELEWVLHHAEDGTAAVSIKYGMFVQNIVDFLIVAVSVFIMVKAVNCLRRQVPAASTPPKA